MTNKVDFLEDPKDKKPKQDAIKEGDGVLYADVKILADYWDADGVRHEGQSVIGLPHTSALQMLAEGKAERVDPLPTYLHFQPK